MHDDELRPLVSYCFATSAGEAFVIDWGDHLEVRSARGLQFVALELISSVEVRASGVTISFNGEHIVIPLSAFEDAQDAAAFAIVLDERRRECSA